MNKVITKILEMSRASDYTLCMEKVSSVATVASVLGDPVRLKILDLLAEGRDETCESPEHPELPAAICPSDLARKLDGMAGSKLSYHLKELREVGLIREHRSGKRIYYANDPQALSRFLRALEERYREHDSAG